MKSAMAVYRIEKNRNYTHMSNYHLRDTTLSNKACGLLSKMLSLPENWDYTTRGLAAICKDGVDSITTQLKELERCGYLERRRIRDPKGKIIDTEYIIYEEPLRRTPYTESPDKDKPSEEKPLTENPAQSIMDQSNTEESITDESIIDSYPSGNCWVPHEGKRSEVIGKDVSVYRELIKENISYDFLLQDMPLERDRLEEILELIVETVCSARQYIRVAGADYPAKAVQARLLKLDMEHIRYILDCLKENTTKIRNIKQYLLTTLYNAPTTIGNYYAAQVQYDMNKNSSYER